MNIVRIAAALVVAASLTAVVGGSLAKEKTTPTDQLCQMLFDDYIKRTGKIDGDLVHGATAILVTRGRVTGFWRQVLAELQRNDGQTELRCVEILGRMLGSEARDREMLRREKETGNAGQRHFFTPEPLSNDVLKELMSRVSKADRFHVVWYLVALVESHKPETAELLRTALRDDQALEAARFFGAIGLAQLGDKEGFTWLVAHSGESVAQIHAPIPRSAIPREVGSCSVNALRQLSTNDRLRTQADCEAWWGKVDKQALAIRRVELRYH